MDKARVADPYEITEILALVEISAKTLQRDFYSEETIEVALELVTGIEQLIADKTYFVVESEGNIVACGGYKKCEETGVAEMKAFFVHPIKAKKGLASTIMDKCIEESKLVGVNTLNLVATLSGEPLYRKYGFIEISRNNVVLSNGSNFEVVYMSKEIGLIEYQKTKPAR